MLKRKLMMLRLMLIPDGYARAEFLLKIRLFHRQGNHCFFVPFNYGTEPYMLSFGDNVYVASGVRFVTHDVTAKMFQYIDSDNRYTSRVGPITVGSNVFIGADTTILYDVTIGSNVIIAAGTLVNSSLPDGGVYGGIPARRIGDFTTYMDRIRKFSADVPWTDEDPFETRREKQMDYFGLSTENALTHRE